MCSCQMQKWTRGTLFRSEPQTTWTTNRFYIITFMVKLESCCAMSDLENAASNPCLEKWNCFYWLSGRETDRQYQRLELVLLEFRENPQIQAPNKKTFQIKNILQSLQPVLLHLCTPVISVSLVSLPISKIISLKAQRNLVFGWSIY
jgi:hypothetical protein